VSSNKLIFGIVVLAALLSFSINYQEAFADTILTFEPPPAVNDEPVRQDYGDNVAAASQGDFNYGDTDGAFTPNVMVSYGPGAFEWDDDYGDLTDVIYSLDDGDSAGVDVTLTADAGFLVLLHSFDMGGWENTDYIINNLKVFKNDDVVPIFSQSEVPIEGDFVGDRHSTFIFDPPLEGQKLRITFDSNNLGSDRDNIGFDNIRFSQILEPKKSNGGDEAWDTRPTSGLNYENGQQLVYNGFGWNGNFLTVEFDHYQPFAKEELKIGERSTLTAKVYASNGLASQSFGLGIQDIGSNDAEVELRANLNRDGSIDSIEVIQKTDVVNPETLTVSNEKVYCKEGDAEKLCDQLEFTFTLQELLQYEKAYSQHIDFKRRAGQIWINHGFEITGEPINPMLTKMIPSAVKYEGLLKVTQVEKYSPYWTTDDDRMFEMNSFGSFKQINQSFERFHDTGDAATRAHSGFGGIIAYEQDRALEVFDSSKLVSELPASFAYIFPETGQRITDEMRQAMLLQEQIAQEVLDEIVRQDRNH